MASEGDTELNELDLDATIAPLVEEDEPPSVSKNDVSSRLLAINQTLHVRQLKPTVLSACIRIDTYSQEEKADSKSDSSHDTVDDTGTNLEDDEDNFMDITLVQVSYSSACPDRCSSLSRLMM